jgi:predicted AAA+ superfamily ATPase
VIDAQLAASLDAVGAVVIEGPKAVGKTETGRRASRSEIRVDTLSARQAFAADPDLLLQGAVPRLIDEWQVEPELWNYVRHAVDDRQATGQFILTGSAVPRDDPARHPGAGRFIHLRMRPMTLAETGHSTGAVSLAAVLGGDRMSAPDPGLTVADLAERIVVGGWPAHLGLSAAQSQRAMNGYIDDICRVDVQRLDGIRRDPTGVRRLISSLARNVATPASVAALTADANGADGTFLAETIGTYLGALDRLMVIEDLPAWKPELRSRARLRATPIRHLSDPSLAAAALNANAARLLREINWMGFLFESLVVRDLRVYAQTLDGRLFHYRDNNGLEADAVIEMPDGRWAAYEIKLGSHPAVVDEAASDLLKLKALVSGGEPVALAVITGTGYTFTRPDGVLQIAVGALRA